ncbi:MAG: glycosyltransferase family 4 protein [Gammaproteobacteria bacterium]|nr:glycosyltransferase family 4 protein [Gammaproteobacteria bacterium]
MHIVMINSYYHPNEPGGAERSVRGLAEALVGLGHQVTVIALGEQRKSYLVQGVEVEQLPIRNRYLPLGRGHDGGVGKLRWHARDSYNAAAGSDIGQLLQRLRPDVVHSHNLGGFSVAAWAAVKRLGLPLVHTTRDFYLLCPKTTMQGRGGCSCSSPCMTCLPFAWPRLRASRLVDHVVGISEFILRRHRDNHYFPNAGHSVIYNSYDPPAVEFRAPGEVVRLGYIGRLAPAKGLDMLIDAMAMLVERACRVELYIAGEGDDAYVAQLHAKSASLPIRFIGHQQPAAFFKEIDIAVVPSIWNEPLGRVVIEAMANGKPVVATPVGGIPELIIPDCGVLAPDTDAASFVSAVQIMLQRLKDMGPSIHLFSIKAAECYTSVSVASAYLRRYSLALSTKSTL